MTTRLLHHDVLHGQSRRVHVGGWALIACAMVLVWSGFLPGLEPARADDQSIVELPVSFQGRNTNTSKVPCFSDGATYTIRGHITAPQGSLAACHGHRITVYLYGYDGGEWNWDLKSVPGYDYAAEMAKLGHVSLTLDELGYGASGRPQDGNLTCQGAEADITHQIIEKLRSGEYVLGT